MLFFAYKLGALKLFKIALTFQYEIIVAQLSKFKLNGGLGISLEGTVEKVDGEEQNPHHYIRLKIALK